LILISGLSFNNCCKLQLGTEIIFQIFFTDPQEFHTAIVMDDGERLKNMILNIPADYNIIGLGALKIWNLFEMALLCKANGNNRLRYCNTLMNKSNYIK